MRRCSTTHTTELSFRRPGCDASVLERGTKFVEFDPGSVNVGQVQPKFAVGPKLVDSKMKLVDAGTNLVGSGQKNDRCWSNSAQHGPQSAQIRERPWPNLAQIMATSGQHWPMPVKYATKIGRFRPEFDRTRSVTRHPCSLPWLCLGLRDMGIRSWVLLVVSAGGLRVCRFRGHVSRFAYLLFRGGRGIPSSAVRVGCRKPSSRAVHPARGVGPPRRLDACGCAALLGAPQL